MLNVNLLKEEVVCSNVSKWGRFRFRLIRLLELEFFVQGRFMAQL